MSLAAIAVLLCVGTAALWTATSQVGPATLTYAGLSHVEQGASGNGHSLDASYLTSPAEEANDGDRRPVNAGLLTALLLVVFMGASVGWLLAYGPRPGLLSSSSIAHRVSITTVREDAPFLGVFRL